MSQRLFLQLLGDMSIRVNFWGRIDGHFPHLVSFDAFSSLALTEKRHRTVVWFTPHSDTEYLFLQKAIDRRFTTKELSVCFTFSRG